MPTTHHDDLEFFAGDDWTISGVLLDINGSALDLTGARFEWCLIDPTGLQVGPIEGGVTVSIVNATQGLVTIVVPYALTEPLAPGRYHDSLRVFLGLRSTYWVGTILVNCDPFTLIPNFQPAPDQVVNLSATPLLTGPIDMEKP